MNNVIAAVEGSDEVEVVAIDFGGSSGGYWHGVIHSAPINKRNTTTTTRVQRRGARQRIQAYNALLRFRHDVEIDNTVCDLMKTCKNKKEPIEMVSFFFLGL